MLTTTKGSNNIKVPSPTCYPLLVEVCWTIYQPCLYDEPAKGCCKSEKTEFGVQSLGRPGYRRRERDGREGRRLGSYLLLSMLMYAGLYVDCVWICRASAADAADMRHQLSHWHWHLGGTCLLTHIPWGCVCLQHFSAFLLQLRSVYRSCFHVTPS